MPISKAELAAQQSALDLYLRVKQAGDSQIPTLDAALCDARVTMAAGQALWLATAGYLIVIEMMGQTVARSSTKFREVPRQRALRRGLASSHREPSLRMTQRASTQ